MNGGLSGYWTSYIFNQDPGSVDNELERWLLEHSTFASIRERYGRMSALASARLRPGMRVASVPCGVMDDLLRQPSHLLNSIEIVGIDIDHESLLAAEALAERLGSGAQVDLIQGDAWEVSLDTPVDLILSNGLNLYESDPSRLISLYRQFRDNLRPGGELHVTYIPPLPPAPIKSLAAAQVWQSLHMSEADYLRDRAIFGDILKPAYLNVTETSELATQLSEAGLSLQQVHFGSYGLLPIAVAVRREVMANEERVTP